MPPPRWPAPRPRPPGRRQGAVASGSRPNRVPSCYSHIASYGPKNSLLSRRTSKAGCVRRADSPDAGPVRATAEAIRLELAEAWGEMGAAWGVTPAIARVQAYLMARQEPLTEREVREALGLSHRAASLALAEAESWGIVERVRSPAGSGAADRPGPPISRSATTGSGSGGSSPSARSAKATRSSPSSRRRNARPRRVRREPR